jgi:glycosyltransferase involved in cell wall biosynthesis
MTVSVMLKTYNHAPYVAQAIESALAQQTTFPVEIVVGDDGSTDGTPEIVREYAARHPGRIRVLERAGRVGMVRNTMDLYRSCRGRFVAWLDGDDFWIDSGKLEKQVEFLTRHQSFTLSFHDADVMTADGRRTACPISTPGKSAYEVEDLLLGPPGFSCSCVFRKVIDEFPPWFADLPFADWALEILHAEQGPAGHLPEVMAVYRDHGASARALGFTGRGDLSLNRYWASKNADVLRVLNRHFGFKYDRIVRTELLKLSPAGAWIYQVTGRHSPLRSLAWRTLRRVPPAARVAIPLAGRVARAWWTVRQSVAGRRRDGR